jgi:hypothetical protein
MACAMALYRPRHIERMVGMVMKAVGVRPPDMIGRAVSGVAWRFVQWRARKLAPFRQEVLRGAAASPAKKLAA